MKPPGKTQNQREIVQFLKFEFTCRPTDATAPTQIQISAINIY